MKIILDKKECGFDAYFVSYLGTAKLIGQFECDVDGFYKWWPSGGGYMESDFLYLVANELKRLNAEWEKEVEEMCQDSED